MFKEIGYFKEYYVKGKFIGKLTCEQEEREIGYIGRRTETTPTTIILDNGKKIKQGTEVMTIYYPMSGKSI